MTGQDTGPARLRRPPVWLAPFFLAGLVWFSQFYWSGKFGLYEDDYIVIEGPQNHWKFDSYKSVLTDVCRTYLHGRPLLFVFGYSLGYVTTTPGGTLGVAYAVAFAIQVFNACLVLLVARRAIGPRLAPLAAAVFALAPADTTHQFLHACFSVLPSVAFMLLSILAYQAGRRALSYLPAALTLVTYETCFLPLLLAPFLAAEGPAPRRVALHGAIMGAILLAAFAVRSRLGEERVAAELSDRSVAAWKAVRLATTGPATSATAFASKPRSTFDRLTDPGYFTGDGMRPFAAAWAIIAATVFGVVLIATGTASPEQTARRRLARVALAGAAMIVASYPVALNRDPTILEGRMSSVHLTGSTGWALLVGALTALALSALPRSGRRAVWVLAAAYVAALAAYQVTVQRDYVRGWGEQRRFWAEVNRLCPDIDDETIILVPFPPRKCAAVEVNSHADYILLGRMYFKVSPWKNPPMLLHDELGNVPPDYAGYPWPQVKVDGDELVYRHWTGRRIVLRPGKVIALYPDGDGRYRRLTGALDIHGVNLPLREPGAPTEGIIWLPLRFQIAPAP